MAILDSLADAHEIPHDVLVIICNNVFSCPQTRHRVAMPPPVREGGLGDVPESEFGPDWGPESKNRMEVAARPVRP